jgi:hypothetical protein
MITLASIIDTGALLKVIAASFVATTALAVCLGYAIVGATRSAELRRDGRDSAATAYGALGLISVLLFVGGVVVGLIVMTHK